MSSDQTQPEWWQRPQDPKKKQGNQESQGTQDLPTSTGYQDSQATRQVPTNQGDQGFPAAQGNQGLPPGQEFPAAQAYQGNQDYPGSQGAQGTQGLTADQGFPGAQGYQGAPGRQGAQDYQAAPGYQGAAPGYQGPAAQGPAAQGYQGPPARVRRRRRRWPLITLIVIIVVLVVGDRAANAYTENQMASQIQSSLGLSGKPTVTIQGFPFLTQLAARDFNTVDVNASNETITSSSAGSGLLKVASLTATLHGMHIHGFNSATIDQFNASALITFTALGDVGGIPQGITLSADGPNQIKADISIGPLSETAVAQVTRTGSNQITVKVIDAGGIPTDILGNLADFSFSIPKLPAGVTIQSISVTQQGLRITATGQNTTLSQ